MMTIIQYLSKFVGLYDSKTSRIIMPTMNLPKTVSEICQEKFDLQNHWII